MKININSDLAQYDDANNFVKIKKNHVTREDKAKKINKSKKDKGYVRTK